MIKNRDSLIRDKRLGYFRRTGECRTPRKGEYYACEIVKGIGCAAHAGTTRREILEPVPDALVYGGCA